MNGLDAKWTDLKLARHYLQYEPIVDRFVYFAYPDGPTDKQLISMLKPHFAAFIAHDKKRAAAWEKGS